MDRSDLKDAAECPFHFAPEQAKSLRAAVAVWTGAAAIAMVVKK